MEADFSSHNSVMDSLTEIAFNLRWSWNHAADELWSQLDPELWKLSRGIRGSCSRPCRRKN